MLLGFIGYYRSFIPAYAKKTSNMNSQKMYKKLALTAEMESELETLKDELERAPILAVPQNDSGLIFQLTTNYSQKAMSAFLSQIQNGHERLSPWAERQHPPKRNTLLGRVWRRR